MRTTGASSGPAEAPARTARGADVDIIEGRTAEVGSLPVRRTLPTRGRRTVGAWCFVDHMGPVTLPSGRGMRVPPHPHIGLQTVTWLFAGAALHRDSLGSEQVIRPGQLNLMTAGAGIAHSEEDPGGPGGELHGMQLWIAQPEATRNGPASFEHHRNLPRVDLDRGTATVLVGRFAGATSPARRDTDHAGIELDLLPGTTTLPLDPTYEHALVVADGSVTIGGRPVTPGRLAYLVPGADELALTVDATERVRAVLVGGVPLGEQLTMWWNFVARTRDEISDAYLAWVGGDDRFAPVASGLDRVGAGAPPWLASP
ncbi:MAG: pirin family protein [Acidimicrobiales bacterium]|jgi:redox-sensitive bicupin YhaK (pirin superfamily)